MHRPDLIHTIQSTPQWDILVIGGGATGLGIALEARTRGYSVLLLEKADFASGTSSRSTKLIHGGVRYLAQGDVALVREAGTEREILYSIAPHLVHDLQFIIPVYTWWSRLKYTIGLKLYDWVSGKLSWGNSEFVKASEAPARLENVRTTNLLGGVLYHDGQFDDARLALNLAQTIHHSGGTAVNYIQVNGLCKNSARQVCGVEAVDLLSGQQFTINARAVINATGVFADNVLAMDNPNAQPAIRPSQGIHLVVDRKFLPGGNALMIPETSDGRVLFGVPWHNRVILGTTDTPVDQVTDEPKATVAEVDFILQTAAEYLIKAPERSDVLSVYAGLRPLAAQQNNKGGTKEISRSHKIERSASGLYTILGGKWTTYRRMGEDMISYVEKSGGWSGTTSATRNKHIHGYMPQPDTGNPLYYYGSDLATIQTMIDADPDGWISQCIPLHRAQVEWAAKNEMVQTLEDMLSRRCRALLMDARETLRIAPAVAEILAKHLDKDKGWADEQLNSFNSLATQYILN